MDRVERQAHWQNVYTSKREHDVSWFEESPAPSLDMLDMAGAGPSSAVIDIGGGASRLVDALVRRGYQDVTVLDLSEAALAVAKARLGDLAERVEWIVADATIWQPARVYDVWHDRAAFHFLTDAGDRAAYVERLRCALRGGGHAIIGTFAPDGPEKCSGLPVARYDSRSLAGVLGEDFSLVHTRRHDHLTPWGAMQHFQFTLLRREGPPDAAAARATEPSAR